MCIFKRTKTKVEESKTKINNFHITVELKVCSKEEPSFEKLSRDLSEYFDNYMREKNNRLQLPKH